MNKANSPFWPSTKLVKPLVMPLNSKDYAERLTIGWDKLRQREIDGEVIEDNDAMYQRYLLVEKSYIAACRAEKVFG